MSFGSVVVAIVAILAYTAIRIARMQNPSHGGSGEGMAPSTIRERELQREIEDLRERIKVIERITTDAHKPQALAAEIESLRGR